MQLEEFQLRYMGYEGLNERFSLWWDEDTLLKLSDRTDKWQITKKLTQVSPDGLKQATLETYTDFKKDFLKKFYFLYKKSYHSSVMKIISSSLNRWFWIWISQKIWVKGLQTL